MDDVFSLNTIVIIFIILFPGIIIRRSFYSNKFSKQFYSGEFSERIITTLFWGIINIIFAFALTFIFFKLIIYIPCISCTIQQVLYQIITFDLKNKGIVLNNISFLDVSLYVGLFIFNLFILPFIIGKTAFIIVRKLKLDLKHTAFSFSNQWHYFFKGEIIHKTDGKIIDKNSLDFRTNKTNLTVLDILTLEGDKKYIYKGILLDYNLKVENEELDSIILFEPRKKNYDKDKVEGEFGTYLNFEKIPGNFILIPYSNVLNINVTIKPFGEQIDSSEVGNTSETTDVVASSELPVSNETNESSEIENDGPKGCAIGLGMLLLVGLAIKFASGISYQRFVFGLLFIIFFMGLVVTIIDSIKKEFSIFKMICLALCIIVSYNGFIWIFNVDAYNPAKLLIYLLKSYNS